MNGVDRTRAKQLTRIGQAAAVVLAAGAVMAFVVEPALPEAPQIVRADPQPTDTEPERFPEQPDLDISLVTMMLNQAGEVEPAFETADVSTEPTPITPITEPDKPAASNDTNYRFLGGFFSPNRSLAIIGIGDTQKMVRVGDAVDFGYTVKSITDEAVELERAGEITTLEREAPSGVMVSTASPVGGETPETNLAPGSRVSQSARDRLRAAREEANRRTQTDRAQLRADYEKQRQQRIEELREQGIEVEDAEWRRDD